MKTVLYISVILIIFSCKKAEDRSCFKCTGDVISKEVFLEDFDKMHLGPHIRYELVQDTINKLVITGGSKLVNLISSSITESELIIENKNRCNFLRSYKKGEVLVEIHFKELINVLFEGTKELTCRDTINSQYFVFVIRDGAGHVDLKLKAESLSLVVTHGWGNYNVEGEVNNAKFDIRSNGFGDTYKLKVFDVIDLVSNSQQTLKINADKCILNAQTDADGDVWYIGIPDTIKFNQYGTGDLLDKN